MLEVRFDSSALHQTALRTNRQGNEMNDYDDWDREGGDSLTDVGFFIAALVAAGSLAVLVWMML